MEEALKKFIEAGMTLSEKWDNEKVKSYPKYLPSFDEFIVEFTGILEGQAYYLCIDDYTELEKTEDGWQCPKCGCYTIAPEEDGMSKQYK